MLGEAFSESRPLDVAAVADEVDPRTIVLFILSLGADPTTLVEALAKRRKVGRAVRLLRPSRAYIEREHTARTHKSSYARTRARTALHVWFT
jgi:hypothetical protein